MASSSTTAKVALDKVAWEFVQDECRAKSKHIKHLKDQTAEVKDQIRRKDGALDYLEARLATLENENSEKFNMMDAAREEVDRLRAKTKELESENDRLRDQLVGAPSATLLCTVTRR